MFCRYLSTASFFLAVGLWYLFVGWQFVRPTMAETLHGGGRVADGFGDPEAAAILTITIGYNRLCKRDGPAATAGVQAHGG